ncbi:hypothetical protein HRG_001343 [Hirsutella rhossiliensis]|uniref:Uncharacterized protein n=1 Tax=Hirsutella rhossiliensis TaxID=111463 RepID=A0A9P8SN52_9HYPO|nr:uncharacterized protein HRG_01343 [Hirsutella rhossiliensis]KAH0968701.1 hypothetical protein HRG_01343 [Hirsutella rhossiliensis]
MSDTTYDKVPTADSEFRQNAGDCPHQEEISSPAPKSPLRRHSLEILLAANIAVALVLLICWGAFVPPPTNLKYESVTPDNKSYPSGQLTWSQHFEAIPCGKSPEEAQARGCRFDMLATAWLPPRCIDDELVDEFMSLGDWEFYTEMHGSIKHSSYEPEILGSFSKPKSIWTSRSWHHMHCLYMWKKVVRALVKGTPVDAETVSGPHTHHCMKAMEEVVFGPHRDPDEIEVFLEIIYPPC